MPEQELEASALPIEGNTHLPQTFYKKNATADGS